MEKVAPIAPSRSEKSKQQCSQCDAGLLFCCMDMLQIDRTKLMRDEPLLYRELQGVCTLCPNRQECSLDLAAGKFDAGNWQNTWEEWWLYCPNSAMLRTIGALQKCGRSPRYARAADSVTLGLPRTDRKNPLSVRFKSGALRAVYRLGRPLVLTKLR
jgi:hypothetical protein